MAKLSRLFLLSGLLSLGGQVGSVLAAGFELEGLSFEHPLRPVAVLEFAALNQPQTERLLNTDQIVSAAEVKALLETADTAGLILVEQLPSGQDLHLVFYSKQGQPRKVLTVAMQRRYADGGGFSSLDGIGLFWDKSQSRFASLYITQTSLPGKSDRPFRPGPPIARVFQYDITTQLYKQKLDQ